MHVCIARHVVWDKCIQLASIQKIINFLKEALKKKTMDTNDKKFGGTHNITVAPRMLGAQ